LKNKKIVFIAVFICLPIVLLGNEINTAVSVRSAKLEGKKFDFHVSFGYESKSLLLDLSYERENGGYYKSDRMSLSLSRYSKISHVGDEVRDIDIESLLLHIPVSVFDFGLDQTWRNFGERKTLLNVGLGYKFLDLSYSSNFSDREIILGKMEFERKVSKKINLILLFRYKKFNSAGVWRVKFGIKYVFN
jgi:hypothetical protein